MLTGQALTRNSLNTLKRPLNRSITLVDRFDNEPEPKILHRGMCAHDSYSENEGMARILAVDDSKSMLEMVSFTLQGAGHEVINACNGAEAMTKAQATTADLVLTDVNMPEMDGLSLVRKLRSMSTYKFTPMLILTTESSKEKKLEGKAAGATGWIVKPFDPDVLLATIRKVLD
jgi:two-component system chemotaxis response regulator CheY